MDPHQLCTLLHWAAGVGMCLFYMRRLVKVAWKIGKEVPNVSKKQSLYYPYITVSFDFQIAPADLLEEHSLLCLPCKAAIFLLKNCPP
jgi:hypothetical protein